MPTYKVEKAKTGRSGCKKCKDKIEKDEIRIGTITEAKEGHSLTTYVHVRCFTLPRALVKEGTTAESFVAKDLDDPNGLLDDHKDEIILAIESKPEKTTPKKKSAPVGENTILGTIKRNFEAIQSAAEDPPAKKVKLSDDEHTEVSLYEKFSKMKLDEIKDFLRWNRQILSGIKAVLILRCIDGEMRGRLAKCPLCKRGQPKIAEADHDYASCNGFFDEVMGGRVSCSFKVPVQKAARILPWYTETPTEEQEAEMDALAEVVKSGKVAASSSNESTVRDLLKKAKSVDWKVGNKSDNNATTTAMMTIAQDGGVALPEGNEKKSVGKLVVANGKTSTAQEVMQMIIDEFGFANDRAAAAEATADAATSVCAVAANAKFYAMLDEFQTILRKSGEFMKANSYKKASDAIASLDFEITEENALKLGKAGKSKVPGIGKSTAEKLQELAQTGSVAKLEEIRASVE